MAELEDRRWKRLEDRPPKGGLEDRRHGRLEDRRLCRLEVSESKI